MFFYSRRSRQTSPERPAAPPEDHSGDAGDASNNVASPNNSTNKNSNPSPSNPSNPSQSPRPVLGDTSSPSPVPRMSRESEGYPSWLPKRPPPPPPGSTFHSSMGLPDFDQDFGVIRDRELHDLHRDAELTDTGAEGSFPVPYFGGRRPTPRSVRIVSLQDSLGGGGAVDEGKRIPSGQSYRHLHPDDFATPPSGHPETRVLTRAGGAGVSAAAQAAASANPSHPRFNARGLHLQIFRSPSKLTRIYFYLYPLVVFANVPLQTFFDFNAVFILVQVSKYPNPLAPGVPGSGRNWALGAAAYIACWLVWILIVTILFEIIYLFVRRWRIKRPAIMPLYLSASGFNLVCMSSYTNFCFMQHLRLSAFTSRLGSLRDGLAETFFFYSQNLPTVVLLLPRAALSMSLLFSYTSPLPAVLLDNTNITTLRDTTFFDQDGSLSGYARGVLIANAVWTAWRILVLLCSWVGLWLLSGQGCAGLCGPRYRWEEDENMKKRYSYLYGDAGSEDLGSTLAWSWRQCTRMRIMDAYEFCLTIDRPVTWLEKKDDGVEDDGVAQVMAAIGFPSIPQPARRSVLSGDLFEDPKDPALSDSGLPKVVKRSSKERQQLAEPYPFTMTGAQVSSADRMIPFPDSASAKDVQSPSSAATSGSTDGAEPTEQPSSSYEKPRESGSLSSFGQPVSSRYPFQFRQPPGGNARAPPRARTESSPATAGSSDDGADETTDSSVSRAARSGDTSSRGRSQPTSSSDESGRSSIPMPPRHPQQVEGRSRARRRPDTAPPITPATSSTIVHPVLFPRAQGAIPIIIPAYEEQGHHTMDDNRSIASSHSEDDSIGLLSPASAHSARSPRPSFIAHMIGGVRGSAPGSRTQSQSSATSSDISSSHPLSSPRSFHSSFGSANVSVVGARPGRSRSPSRPRASMPRTRTSSASAYVRSRAQSLMQGIGAASHSSLELVQNVINRSRTDSMMARLDEGEHEHEGSMVGDTIRLPHSPLRHPTSNIDDEPDVQDDDENEVDDVVGYDARISGLYDAQQQHADISYYSDGRTHSRSGSGSTSAMSSSNENYTFGQPFPHRTRLQQVGEGPTVEEEGELEEEQVPTTGPRSRRSSQSVALGETHRATPDGSSSSSRSRSSRRPTPPNQPVPAALSPMRPRTYHTTAGGHSSSRSSPDMPSTAAAVEGSTTEPRVFSTSGSGSDEERRARAL